MSSHIELDLAKEWGITEHEDLVMTHLAKDGPMTGYDFHLGGRRIHANGPRPIMAKRTFIRARDRLLERGFVRKVVWPKRPKGDRRRDFYWLDRGGVLYEIYKLEYSDSIRNWLATLKTTDEESNLAAEIGVRVGRKYVRQVLNLIFAGFKGRLTELSPQDEPKLNEPTRTEIRRLLMKYPTYRKAALDIVAHNEVEIKRARELLGS